MWSWGGSALLSGEKRLRIDGIGSWARSTRTGLATGAPGTKKAAPDYSGAAAVFRRFLAYLKAMK